MKHDRLYLEQDADLNVLTNRRIAVLGYGSQGHAQAQNLRDSGLDVLIGNIEDRFATQARADGFEVVGIADAVKRGDVVLMLIPDEEQPAIYTSQIAPNLKDNQALCFASGYAVHFNLLRPPPFVDVVLAVPTCVGALVRERFVKGQGVFGHFGVHQNHSGTAREWQMERITGQAMLHQLKQEAIHHPIREVESLFLERKKASGG